VTRKQIWVQIRGVEAARLEVVDHEGRVETVTRSGNEIRLPDGFGNPRELRIFTKP
jgi:hypothetical protein